MIDCMFVHTGDTRLPVGLRIPPRNLYNHCQDIVPLSITLAQQQLLNSDPVAVDLVLRYFYASYQKQAEAYRRGAEVASSGSKLTPLIIHFNTSLTDLVMKAQIAGTQWALREKEGIWTMLREPSQLPQLMQEAEVA